MHFRFCKTGPQRNSEHHFLCCLCKESSLEVEEDVHTHKGSAHLAAASPTGPWCSTSHLQSPLPPWPTPWLGPKDLQPGVHHLSQQPRPAHSLVFVHKSYCKRAPSFPCHLQLQWQGWTIVTKIVWPEKLKTLPLDPSKFADTHSRHLFSALWASPARTVGTAAVFALCAQRRGGLLSPPQTPTTWENVFWIFAMALFLLRELMHLARAHPLVSDSLCSHSSSATHSLCDYEKCINISNLPFESSTMQTLIPPNSQGCCKD